MVIPRRKVVVSNNVVRVATSTVLGTPPMKSLRSVAQISKSHQDGNTTRRPLQSGYNRQGREAKELR
jgi:hypothetical protein